MRFAPTEASRSQIKYNIRRSEILSRCEPKGFHNLPENISIPQPVTLSQSKKCEEDDCIERIDPLVEADSDNKSSSGRSPFFRGHC